jgi:hypothetical protein
MLSRGITVKWETYALIRGMKIHNGYT